METDIEDIKQALLREQEWEYHSFLALFRGNADIIDPASAAGTTPEHDELRGLNLGPRIEELHQLVGKSPYLRQFDIPKLRSALKDLELLRADAPGIDVCPDETARKRRELSFLHGLAQILKWRGYTLTPPDPEKVRKARGRIAEMCRELEDLLLFQLEDPHLIRRLHRDDLENLPKVIAQLGRFSEVFDTVELDLPYKKNRKTDRSVERLHVSAIAEQCFRVYEACNYEVMRKLFSSCWLGHYVSTRKGELQTVISQALERKQEAYAHRTSVRDALVVHEIPLMPVRSL